MKRDLSILTTDRFELNGVQEYIISKPKTRDEEIIVTMGGTSKYSTPISVKDFENSTGYCLKGLEPSYEFDFDTEIGNLKNFLIENDFSISEKSFPNEVLSANIEYVTSNNTHVVAGISLYQRDNTIIARLSRDAGYQTPRSKEFEVPYDALPIAIENAKITALAYTSTKVQVLNKDIEKGDREFSKEGFPILYSNESTESYFKSEENNKPAGIVIDSTGKYSAFLSWDTSEGDRYFDSDSRSYKTLSGATKLLRNHGFDPQGRVLNVLDKEEFKSFIHEADRRVGFIGSWDNSVIGYFSTPRGTGVVKELVSEWNDEFGTSYSFDIQYDDNLTGKTYSKNIPVNHNLSTAGNTAIKEFFSIHKELDSLYLDNSGVEFDKDDRTNAQKVNYHVESVKQITKDIEDANIRLKEASGEHNVKFYSQKIEKLKQSIIDHKSSFKELKSANENENDIKLG